MISAVRYVTVAVRDLDRACRFYEETFDYLPHARATVTGAAFEQLWRLPAGMTAEVAVLGPVGADSGRLRLIAFDRPGEPYWGDYGSPQDHGLYALNIRVPEIGAAVQRLRAAGGRSKSSPTRWTVTPQVSAWDSLSYDPDGVILDVFELETAPGSLMDDYDGGCTALQTICLHSGDARQSARFYAALGFRPWYDKMIERMEGFFKIPAGTPLHNINMVMPDSPSIGRIEIAQYVGFPGSSQRDRAVPPNLGLLSASLETTDLAETGKLLRAIGAEPVGEAVEVDLPGSGAVRARSYYGPDDEVLEFYQTL
ncbi:VOC family protein [Micromonosporaceae bacterium DT194]|uniref:VOC family protein n=1 Tax=Melissospora conviva TaxID=3388432 RepID=UPI003C166385